MLHSLDWKQLICDCKSPHVNDSPPFSLVSSFTFPRICLQKRDISRNCTFVRQSVITCIARVVKVILSKNNNDLGAPLTLTQRCPLTPSDHGFGQLHNAQPLPPSESSTRTANRNRCTTNGSTWLIWWVARATETRASPKFHGL